MSVNPPTSIQRIASAAERSQPRSQRASGGDFAVLLELLPASVPAPAAPARERADQRENAVAGASARGRLGRAEDRPGAGQTEPAASGAGQPGPAASGAAGHAQPAPAESTSADPAAAAPALADQTAPAPVADAAQAAGALNLVIPPATPAAARGAQAATASAEAEGVVAAPAAAAAPAEGSTAAEGPISSLPASAAGLPQPAPGADAGHTTGTDVLAGPAAPATTATGGVAAPGGSGEPATPAGAFVLPEEVVAGGALREAGGVRAEGVEAHVPAEASALGTGVSTGGGSAEPGAGGQGQPGSARPDVQSTAAPAAPAPTLPPAIGLQAPTRPLDGLPLGPHREVPLERAPRAVAQLLHVGSQNGVNHARIVLRPVELGGIEVFLQAGPAGVVAQVVAESPEAARMLQQASEDLRRALARHDVELLSLEVSTSSEQQRRDDFAARDGRDPRADHPVGSAGRSPTADEPSADSPTPAPATVLELPDGLLVDVLA